MDVNRLIGSLVVVERDDLAVVVAALEHSYLRPSLAEVFDRLRTAARGEPLERLEMVNTGLGMGLMPAARGRYLKVGGA